MTAVEERDFAVGSGLRIRSSAADSAHIALDKPVVLLAGFTEVIWNSVAVNTGRDAALRAAQVMQGRAFNLGWCKLTLVVSRRDTPQFGGLKQKARGAETARYQTLERLAGEFVGNFTTKCRV
jgi:hypothetical protein